MLDALGDDIEAQAAGEIDDRLEQDRIQSSAAAQAAFSAGIRDPRYKGSNP